MQQEVRAVDEPEIAHTDTCQSQVSSGSFNYILGIDTKHVSLPLSLDIFQEELLGELEQGEREDRAERPGEQ